MLSQEEIKEKALLVAALSSQLINQLIDDGKKLSKEQVEMCAVIESNCVELEKSK